MKKLVCHPKNWEEAKKFCEKIEAKTQNVFGVLGVEVIVSEHIPEKEFRGSFKYQGNVVKKEDINIRTRFVTYGPDDVEWLEYAGIVEKILEPVFFMMEFPDFSKTLQPQLGCCAPEDLSAKFKSSLPKSLYTTS